MNARAPWLTDGVRANFICAMHVPCELHIKSHESKTSQELRGGKSIMAVQRKRFRIEESVGIDMPAAEGMGGGYGPMHREIMAELHAIRVQMGNAAATINSAATATIEGSLSRETAEAHALLE